MRDAVELQQRCRDMLSLAHIYRRDGHPDLAFRAIASAIRSADRIPGDAGVTARETVRAAIASHSERIESCE